MFVSARRNAFVALEQQGTLLLEDVGCPDPAAARPARRDRRDRRPPRRADPGRRPRRRRQHPPDHRLRPHRPRRRRRARPLAFDEVMALAIGLGGTITGEHGVGPHQEARPARPARPRRDGPEPPGQGRARPRPASSTPVQSCDASTDRSTILERHLFGPGPCNPYPEATAALGLPLLGHLDPAFLEIMDETCDRLRTGVGHRRTPAPCRSRPPARPGMEAAFVNTVHPGDVVVVAVNGLFGQRMCEVASRCGAEVVRRRARVGHPGRRRARASPPTRAPRSSPPCTPRPRPASAPTSPPSARAQRDPDALLITDAVTSIAGIELRADDWGVDVGYAGTQKCLGVAPGLAPFTINDRAFERRVEKPRRGTSTSACSVATSARPARAAAAGPTTTPRRSRWSRSLHAGAGPDPRGGARAGLGPPRRGRSAAAGRPRGDGARAVRREGLAAARAHHGAGARRRRLRRRTPRPAGDARHRDRRRGRRRTPPPSGGSA